MQCTCLGCFPCVVPSTPSALSEDGIKQQLHRAVTGHRVVVSTIGCSVQRHHAFHVDRQSTHSWECVTASGGTTRGAVTLYIFHRSPPPVVCCCPNLGLVVVAPFPPRALSHQFALLVFNSYCVLFRKSLAPHVFVHFLTNGSSTLFISSAPCASNVGSPAISQLNLSAFAH